MLYCLKFLTGLFESEAKDSMVARGHRAWAAWRGQLPIMCIDSTFRHAFREDLPYPRRFTVAVVNRGKKNAESPALQIEYLAPQAGDTDAIVLSSQYCGHDLAPSREGKKGVLRPGETEEYLVCERSDDGFLYFSELHLARSDRRKSREAAYHIKLTAIASDAEPDQKEYRITPMDDGGLMIQELPKLRKTK